MGIFAVKRFVQIVDHQHFNGKANRINMIRLQPFANIPAKHLFMFGKTFGPQAVAGGSIINIWQETLYGIQTDLIILNLLDHKGV